MRRKVELDTAAIRKIAMSLGEAYEDAANLLIKEQIKFVLNHYFDTTPEKAFKLASDKYEKFLRMEDITWNRNR